MTTNITIIGSDLTVAINVLDKLTESPNEHSSRSSLENDSPIQFSCTYRKQNIVMTALKILHQTSLEGTSEQQKTLLEKRNKIKILNTQLENPETFIETAKKRLTLESLENDFEGMQIALPKTQQEKTLEKIKIAVCCIFSTILEGLIFPVFAALTILACFKPNFNPKSENAKKRKPAIVMLHCLSFNDTEFLLGRSFLNKEEYGSVYSINYENYPTIDTRNKGIDELAREEIFPKLQQIMQDTECNEIYLIGHSQGGLLATYIAENFPLESNMKIPAVITIHSPLRGTPLVDNFQKLKLLRCKNLHHMSIHGGPPENPNFRQNLVQSALQSERQGKRNYYNIYSSADFIVPGRAGLSTEDPRRQINSYLGHTSPVLCRSTWKQASVWLDLEYQNRQKTE